MQSVAIDRNQNLFHLPFPHQSPTKSWNQFPVLPIIQTLYSPFQTKYSWTSTFFQKIVNLDILKHEAIGLILT